jgi:hypothetical protein
LKLRTCKETISPLSITTAIETQLAALLKNAESGKRKAEENSLLYPLSAFGFPLSAFDGDN